MVYKQDLENELEREPFDRVTDLHATDTRIDKIRMKVRFDYRGTPRPARFFFGGKTTEEVAEEQREQKEAFWRNTPLQGVRVEDVLVYEIYSVSEDEEEGEEVAYAPIELILSVDSLEDSIRFITREEFRRLEILEPNSLCLSAREVERVFYKFSETMQRFFEDKRSKHKRI